MTNEQSSSVTLNQSIGGDESFTKNIDDQKRIAHLEQEVFVFSKQLDEERSHLKEIEQQKESLAECISSFEKDKVERNTLLASIEKSRDELLIEKKELQNTNIILQSQKEQLKLENSRLLEEKRRLNDDVVSLKSDCCSLRQEKTLLQVKFDDFQNEKTVFQYDKSQWSREKEILLQSKQWCMSEITQRETTINELRIQIIKNDAVMMRENSSMLDEKNSLENSIETLKQSLNERDAEFQELKDKFHSLITEKTSIMNEMEAEMRAKERLTDVYKVSLDSAENEITTLRESEEKFQRMLHEKDYALQDLTCQLKESQEKLIEIISEKDCEIRRVTEEAAKATELLNSGFRLAEPNADLATLSPAAAAASSLLKSGKSLTAIYTEHCKLISELDKKNDEYKQLENNITELIEELESKAPKFLEQKNAYEKLCESNDCLSLQNELLSGERQKLESQCSAFVRELAFTKAELERYQREHQILTQQVRRLLFVIEKGPESHDENSDDEFLFANIQDLQSRNIMHLNEIAKLKKEKAQAIDNYHHHEVTQLNDQIVKLKQEFIQTKDSLTKTELLRRQAVEQKDQYKMMYENSISDSQTTQGGRSTILSVHSMESLGSEVGLWRSKAERLQEKLEYFSDDRQQREKILNDRIDSQMEQISKMRSTIGKLESDYEFQTQNQKVLSKQVEEYDKELKKANDALLKTKSKVEGLQTKLDATMNQMIDQQQNLSTLKVQNHSLEDQVRILTEREQRLQTELNILRDTRYSTERMALTLQEVEVALKRVDTERQSIMEGQLQSLTIERDSLKDLIQNLKVQNTQMNNELKLQLNSAISSRDKAQLELRMLQNNFTALEAKFTGLKNEHERIISEASNIHTTDNSIEACKKEIQQLKNKMVYQETQIADYHQKCEELSKLVKSKEREFSELSNLSGNMENAIREQSEFGTLERQRLQIINEQNEVELANSKSVIEGLRNQVAQFELVLLEKQKIVESSENIFFESKSMHQKEVFDLQEQISRSSETVNQLKQSVDTLKSNYDDKLAECEMLQNEMNCVNNNLLVMTKDYEDASKIIDALKLELNSERSRIDKTEILEQEKLHLVNEVAEYTKRERENVEKLDVAYEELQKLLQQNSVMRQIGQALKDESSSSVTSEMDDQGAERFNTLIKYIRTEKQKETELRMNAELELQRVKAQASLHQQNILTLESELLKTKTLSEANSKAALERGELLNRLQVLKDAQEKYSALKLQFDQQGEKIKHLDTSNKELSKAIANKQLDNKALEGRISITCAELEAVKKDNIALKERNNKAMEIASKYSPDTVISLQTEFENQKKNLNQKDREIDLLKKQCIEHISTLKNIRVESETHKKESDTRNQLFMKARTLARQFREEKIKLENEFKDLKTDFAELQSELERTRSTLAKGQSEVSSSTATDWSTVTPNVANVKKLLQEKMTQLTVVNSEKEDVLKQLNESEIARNELDLRVKNIIAELEDANEKCIRMDIITSSLHRTQNKLNEVTTELNFLKAQNEDLTKQLEEYQALRDRSFATHSQPEAVDSTEQQQPTISRKRNISKDQLITGQESQSSFTYLQASSPKRVCIQPEEQEAVTSNFDEFANISNGPNDSYSTIHIDDDVFEDELVAAKSELKNDGMVASALDDVQPSGSASEVHPLDLSLNDAGMELGEQPAESDYQVSEPNYDDQPSEEVYASQPEGHVEKILDEDEELEDEEVEVFDDEESAVEYGDEIDESYDEGDHVGELDDSGEIICLSDDDLAAQDDNDMVGESGQEKDKEDDASNNPDLE